MILSPDIARSYIETFNQNDEETIVQHIPNRAAWDWLEGNMPLFECPDREIEEIYYFRWWVYRKHLKQTSDGMVVTEFHPSVLWAGKHNTINCSAGHHFYEGRWLARRQEFLDDYARFWFRKNGDLRAYSTWLVEAIWQTALVTGDFSLAENLLPDMVSNYHAWEAENRHPSGLFWSSDDRDGMEFSISGSGLRPTLNAYLYADARAIADIARRAGQGALETEFCEKAEWLRALVLDRLWDPHDGFFKCIPLPAKESPVDTWDFAAIDPIHNVRELIGFIPWAFHLATPAHESAWEQLMDPEGFYAPYGPTTAEQRHQCFRFPYPSHECLWNGPAWPFATCQTLTGLANLLHQPGTHPLTRADYLHLLKIYARSHYRMLPGGSHVNWLDENIDPYTGEWLARRILEEWGWRANKGGRERGKDYNHSTFCNLVISGLVGFQPREDGSFTVDPLVPERTWDYFCLDNLSYQGQRISILFDATGQRYGKGQGLQILSG